MHKRRVVITGVGVVASNGVGKEQFWNANMKGISGISKVTSFDTTGFDSQTAGEIKNFDPSIYIRKELVTRADRFVHLGLAATQMAFADSRMDLSKEDPIRIGAIIGSGLGGIIWHEEQILVGYEKGAHRLNPLSVPKITPNAVSGHIAIEYQCLGPNLVISTACASGSYAIGEALRKIQYGETDVCVTGGVEATLSRFNYGAYSALRVTSKCNDEPQKASRPFDLKRDGFVMSEGAGILIVEELEHAKKRNATIYAEIIGYANNSGGHHMVMPDAEGKDASRAMSDAIKDAGLKPSDIGYINAHATSTQANDKAETKAIKNVFGDYAYKVPISSTKSMTGHSIGAAGGIEAIVTALAIRNSFIPPTINYEHPDPACDLDYVPNEGRRVSVDAALSNSFGFGNCNACLIFSKYKE